MPETTRPPSPELIFQALDGYQRTAAMKAAIELDLFTAIGEGATDAESLGKRLGAAERGVRILCDFLVVIGMLTKNGNEYGLTPDTATFLDRRSPKYVGTAMAFRLMPEIVTAFEKLVEAVKHGGTAASAEGIASQDDSVWIEFARSMGALQSLPAEALARHLRSAGEVKGKVLDVAAGHGKFGIALALANPEAQIHFLDWPNVLNVARENARAAGIEGRAHYHAGDALEIELGGDYELIVQANFLQILDPIRIHALLPKLHAALQENGRLVTLGFMPDDNRVTPPGMAAFAIVMLATTTGGDAYSVGDCERMLGAAGFSQNEFQAVPGSPMRIIVSRK